MSTSKKTTKPVRKAITNKPDVITPIIADDFPAKEEVQEVTVAKVGEASRVIPYELYHKLTKPLTLRHKLKYYTKHYWRALLRKLPRIVWYGQEIDVLVTFTNEKLPPVTTNQLSDFLSKQVNPQLMPDGIGEATIALLKSGISFDTGFGERGRDWYFDYSLRGPVRVKFLGPAKYPLKRQE